MKGIWKHLRTKVSPISMDIPPSLGHFCKTHLSERGGSTIHLPTSSRPRVRGAAAGSASPPGTLTKQMLWPGVWASRNLLLGILTP